MPLTAELKLEVWDSPNSAGIVIDAVRCCKLALNHGIGGQLDGPSSYLMKSPMNQRPDDQARADTEEFIAQHARAEKVGPRRRESADKAAEHQGPHRGRAHGAPLTSSGRRMRDCGATGSLRTRERFVRSVR